MSKKADVSEAAAILGSLGRGASKRRDVDYAALGALGGKAGKGKKKPRRPPVGTARKG